MGNQATTIRLIYTDLIREYDMQNFGEKKDINPSLLLFYQYFGGTFRMAKPDTPKNTPRFGSLGVISNV